MSGTLRTLPRSDVGGGHPGCPAAASDWSESESRRRRYGSTLTWLDCDLLLACMLTKSWGEGFRGLVPLGS